MTAIPPVDPSEVPDSVAKKMRTFADLGDQEATFLRVLAHADGYAEALWDAMEKTRSATGVDPKLKEIIRIQLAKTAQDPYFSTLRSAAAEEAGLDEERIDAGLGDFESDDRFTDAEKWALRYAHLMYREPEKLDAAFYDEGKRHFSEAQIMEIGGMVAVHFGMQVFMRTLQPES